MWRRHVRDAMTDDQTVQLVKAWSQSEADMIGATLDAAGIKWYATRGGRKMPWPEYVMVAELDLDRARTALAHAARDAATAVARSRENAEPLPTVGADHLNRSPAFFVTLAIFVAVVVVSLIKLI